MSLLFVSTHYGIEQLLAEELRALGIPIESIVTAGIYVQPTIENVLRINYLSRLAIRVLFPLATFACRDKESLYQGAMQIDWPSLFSLNEQFAIDSDVNHPAFPNTLFPALVVKDAISDTFRNHSGSRPSVNVKAPNIQFHLLIRDNKATISLDTSLQPLYKRGYRVKTGAAPLQENLAAALLYFAQYDITEVLVDPFCGSGTILIEAAMMASNTPAGFFRTTWGFFFAPGFTKKIWEEIKSEADASIRHLSKGRIIGSDMSAQMINIARENLRETPFAPYVELHTGNVQEVKLSKAPTMIVTNPPYGERIEVVDHVYRNLGNFVRTQCSRECRLAFITSSKKQAEATGLSLQTLGSFSNGGIPVKVYGF